MAAGAGRQNKPLGRFCQLIEDRRKIEFLKRFYFRRNHPESGAQVSFLKKNIGPETGPAVKIDGKINLSFLFKAFLLLFIETSLGDSNHRLPGKLPFSGNRKKLAVDTDDRRLSDIEMQVGSALLSHHFQITFEFCLYLC